MRARILKRSWRCLGSLVFAAAFLSSLGGCPIDGNQVVTDTVQAALQSAVTSFVASLSKYLAGQ